MDRPSDVFRPDDRGARGAAIADDIETEMRWQQPDRTGDFGLHLGQAFRRHIQTAGDAAVIQHHAVSGCVGAEFRLDRLVRLQHDQAQSGAPAPSFVRFEPQAHRGSPKRSPAAQRRRGGSTTLRRRPG